MSSTTAKRPSQIHGSQFTIRHPAPTPTVLAATARFLMGQKREYVTAAWLDRQLEAAQIGSNGWDILQEFVRRGWSKPPNDFREFRLNPVLCDPISDPVIRAQTYVEHLDEMVAAAKYPPKTATPPTSD